MTRDNKNCLASVPAMIHYRMLGDVDGTALHLTLGYPDETRGFACLRVSLHRSLFLTAADDYILVPSNKFWPRNRALKSLTHKLGAALKVTYIRVACRGGSKTLLCVRMIGRRSER